MTAEVAMYIAAAASATSAMASAQQQSVSMSLQAQQAELQGRQGALNYNKQANAVLDRQNQLAAMIRARAAAGGVNPDTGSAMTLQEVNAMKAGEEFNLAKANAETLSGSIEELKLQLQEELKILDITLYCIKQNSTKVKTVISFTY
jgi:hypothetical protein